MNRPTIGVDDLLEMTDEALAGGDYPQAIEMLRKAASIAPLRKDIRNKMAIALEGAPVSDTDSRRYTAQSPVKDGIMPKAGLPFDVERHQPQSYEDEAGRREVIGQIARKAFESAAGQTARASNATRHLTNLLQQGIHTWKSSMAEFKRKPPDMPISSRIAEKESDVSASIQSRVFKPETDLDNYLKRASASHSGLHPVQADADDDLDDGDKVEKTEKVGRAATTSKQTAKTLISNKSSRPTDVEDVLAAGISGFIEALGHTNKLKIIYGFVYVALIFLFGYACFDVSRKFPAVETIPGSQTLSAGFGSLNLTETDGSSKAVATARAMVAAGNHEEAIQLLRVQLRSGQLLHNRDLIRIELAAILNDMAEQHLRSNQFSESVARYKEALDMLPVDAALQLRLGNALYYQGSLGTNDPSLKKSLLSEAAIILETVTSKDPSNLQAHRLLAVVYEAQGNSRAAKAAWKKVMGLAAADSVEFKEADSHLK